ncbi:MAG: hypothetical protein PVI99_02645 [Anaerolineales bacterium]|jgi:hypothetical protein
MFTRINSKLKDAQSGNLAAFRYYTEPASFSVLIFNALALLVCGAAAHGVFSVLEEEYMDTTTQEAYPLMQKIQSETPPDSLLVIPLRGGDYRLGARRAVYVDWKSHPYLGEEVLEWWARVAFVRSFYDLTGAER